MSEILSHKLRWWTVAIYAVAMAWVEAAVVYYLRTMVDRIEPYQSNPLPIAGGLGTAEFVREAATLVMLLAVGTLAGRTARGRLGYTALAFGIWDIFYYVFLKALCGWPHSLFDWDILFLLPVPWWGPVLAPVCIAVLMIVWGTLVNHEGLRKADNSGECQAWAANFLGVILALYLFMADTMRVAGQGVDALRTVLPAPFNWPWFCVALLLMSTPPSLALWKIFRKDHPAENSITPLPVSRSTESGWCPSSASANKDARSPEAPMRQPNSLTPMERV